MKKEFVSVLFILFMMGSNFCKSSQLDDTYQIQLDLERKIGEHTQSIEELSKQEEACWQNQSDLIQSILEQKKEHYLAMQQINFKMIQNSINGYGLRSIDKEECDLIEQVIQNRKQFFPNDEQLKRIYFSNADCKDKAIKKVEIYAHGDRKETEICFCDLHDKPTIIGIDVADLSGKFLLEVYTAKCY